MVNANRKISHFSTFLKQWAALVGIPPDRITTEIAENARTGFNTAIQKIWDSAQWLENSPYGEARFIGNRLSYPNDLAKSLFWDNESIGGTPTITDIGATSASNPTGLAFDSTGNLYIAMNGSGLVRKITPLGVQTTFASGMSDPYGLAFDSSGNLFVSNYNGGNINRITPGGVVTDLGVSFLNPAGLAMDASDNLYVAENGNGMIRKVTPLIIVSVFCSGLSDPIGLAWDASHTFLYSSNYNGLTIDKITTGGTATGLGLGFSNPLGLAFDTNGDLFIACNGNNTILRLVLSTLSTTTYASAGISDPTFLAFNSSGNLYVSESNDNLVNKLVSVASTSVTLTANAVANPADGDLTATKMMEVADFAQHGVTQSVENFYPQTGYTASFYARPNGRAWQYLHVFDGVVTYTAFFNTQTGQVGSFANFSTATIAQQPNGFWLCQATLTTGTTTDTNGHYRLLISTDGSTTTYSGDASKGAYFWGALLQQTTLTPVNDLILPWIQLGENEIDTVFNVWPVQPFANNYPSQLGYNLTPTGIQIINGSPYQYTYYANGVAQNNLYGAPPNQPVFIYYRTTCPNWDGDVYDATLTYEIDDQIYFVDSKNNGDFYVCLQDTTVGQSPTTTPGSWERLTVWNAFVWFCIYSAYGDWLLSDGQAEKATGAYGIADDKLSDELDKALRQMEQLSPMKMQSHLTSRPAY